MSKKKLLSLMLSFFLVGYMSAQSNVSGVVTDQSGLSLIGANVIIKGTTLGTITDIDGRYNIEVPNPDSDILLVSYTGFTTMEMNIDGKSMVDIIMNEGELLNEIVFTGYTSSKKSELTEAVSTVRGDELTLVPIASVDNLLQGKSTGVEVTAINGKPGQQGYIRVRGLTSITGNNEPLYVIDGLPMPSTAYAALNPNDIAEISVLKDAAATAIYGARASAGVVLVTTKTGDAKNSFMEYTVQVGSKTALDDGFDLMSGEQKLDYEIAAGVRAELLPEERAALLKYGTDWEDQLLRDGQLISHNLAFSGGNADGGYYASLSRYDEQGISLGSDFDRTTAKINGNYNVTDWVNVSSSLNLSRRNDTELRDRYNVQSPFVAIYRYNPYETVFNLDENGDPIVNADGTQAYNFTHQGFNIVEAIEKNPEKRRYSDIFGNIAVTLTPIDNFSFTSQGSYTYNTFRNEYFIQPGSILDFYVGDPDAPGIKRDSGNDRDRYNWINTAQYDLKVTDDSNVQFLAGTEFIKDQFESFSISGKGFPGSLTTQDNAAEITNGNTTRSAFSIFSMFGKAKYNMGSRLHVAGTLRRDGSSRFGADNRYGTFYALSAGYDLSSLSFLENSPVNQMKVRASYGTSGNEPRGLYSSLGTIGFTSYGNQTAAFQNQVANPSLKWETKVGYNLGLDFSVWNSRLTGSLDFYNQTSKDLLFPNQLSRTTGFSSRTENIGDLTNKGVELELGYAVFEGQDFTFDVGLRYSHNSTTIDALNVEDDIAGPGSFISRLKAGEKAYIYELVEFVRVDNQTGDLIYLDADGEETNSPTASDAKLLTDKSALPTYSGGVNFTFGFKGLSLRTDFSFKGGNWIYNGKKADLLNGANGARSQQSVEALDFWQNPGDVTDIPRLDAEVEASTSTRFLEKGDYIRLRNVQLSYALPNNLVSRAKVQGVTLFIAGSNLATWTDYTGDPEVGVSIEESVSNVTTALPGEYGLYSYPNTRSFTGGLTLRF